MSHTPKQIADLARAALAAPAMVESKIGLIVNPVRWQFMEACTPATILALCERLRLASATIPDYSPDFPASAEYMNRPLTPEAQAEEARP